MLCFCKTLIDDHRRCRKGRTTSTRLNWPNRPNATMVSGYFLRRDGSCGDFRRLNEGFSIATSMDDGRCQRSCSGSCFLLAPVGYRAPRAPGGFVYPRWAFCGSLGAIGRVGGFVFGFVGCDFSIDASSTGFASRPFTPHFSDVLPRSVGKVAPKFLRREFPHPSGTFPPEMRPRPARFPDWVRFFFWSFF